MFFLCVVFRSASSLELLGSMQYKVSVQATDDSYDKARQSMAEREEESKKQRLV